MKRAEPVAKGRLATVGDASRTDQCRCAALYARVSTTDQNTAAQVEALRRYVRARGWKAEEFVDHGVSGAKERRPALDALLAAARRREVGVVVVTKLDRLARTAGTYGRRCIQELTGVSSPAR